MSDSTPKSALHHPLFLYLAAPLSVGLILLIGSRVLSSNDARTKQLQELYGLVSRMTSDEGAAFRSDVDEFRKAMEEHKYDDALGISHLRAHGNMYLLVDAASGDANALHIYCDNPSTGTVDACYAQAKPFVRNSFEALELALYTELK